MNDDIVEEIRGEATVTLGGRDYRLCPIAKRAARLDSALPKGIIGTLTEMANQEVMKAEVLATVVFHLSDGPKKKISDIAEDIFDAGLLKVGPSILKVLSTIAGVGSDEGTETGNAEAPVE